MKFKSQQGMSMIGTLIVVILVVSGMFLGIKLIPLYINDYAIGKAVNSLKDEDNLYDKSKGEILDFVRRKLAADYTTDLSDEAFKITKNKGVITIDVIYESRIPVVYNLDLIAKFEHHIEQKK